MSQFEHKFSCLGGVKIICDITDTIYSAYDVRKLLETILNDADKLIFKKISNQPYYFKNVIEAINERVERDK